MSLRSKILAVIAVPMIVLVLATAALLVSRHQTNQSLAAERYVAALNDGYERVVADLAQAQMGMHGYLLTGQDRFLDPFNLAVDRIPRDMLTLRETTRDHPDDTEEVAKLQNLVDQRLPALEVLLPFAPITGMQDPAAVIDVLVDGDVVTAQIREIAEEVRSESVLSSSERRRDLDRARNLSFAIGVVGMPLGVFVSLMVVMLFVERLARRIERTEEIARMLDEGMPFRDPSASEDELGRLERVLVRSGTRVVELQGELRRMGTSDPLTRLMNRRGFLPSAEHQLRVATRMHATMALMFLDLDGLKSVNDTLGHAAGDGMITEGAFILRETFRASDLIARMGGDEFCVLFPADSYGSAKIALTRLKNAVDKTNAQEDRAFVLSFSAGVAIFDPEDPRTVDELIAVADEQMYVRKRAKGPRPVVAAS